MTPRLVELVRELQEASEKLCLWEHSIINTPLGQVCPGDLIDRAATELSRLMAEGGLVGAWATPLEVTDAMADAAHHAARPLLIGTATCRAMITAALQANEVKRLSNPVDDGAVERALDAYYEVQGELHVHEDDNKRRMRAALEAAGPHP